MSDAISFGAGLVIFVLALIVAVGIFVSVRSLMWWYWGISEHLANQKRIIELLEGLANPQLPTQSPTQQSVSTPQSQPRPAINPLTKRP